jgi:hypothetical protein
MKRLRVPRHRQPLLLRGFHANVQDRTFPVTPFTRAQRDFCHNFRVADYSSTYLVPPLPSVVFRLPIKDGITVAHCCWRI